MTIKESDAWLDELPEGSVVVELPVKLPTWNALLAMNRWKRAKVRHLMHRLICWSSVTVVGSRTWTACPQKQQLMAVSIAEYYATITRVGSVKSGTGKSKSKTKKTRRRY